MAETTTAPAQTKVMQLVPYIFFYGRCEEALEFYKQTFGGTYELLRNEDSPMRDEVAADSGKKVMHATFHGPSIDFMASDGREVKQVDPDAGNISLGLSLSDQGEGERVFNALSQGGKVTMPLGEAFWGGKFGMLVDRFGTEWLVNIS